MAISNIDDFLEESNVASNKIDENNNESEVDDLEKVDKEETISYEEDSDEGENDYEGDDEKINNDELEQKEDDYGNKDVMSKNMKARLKKIQEKHESELSLLRSQLSQKEELSNNSNNNQSNESSDEDWRDQFQDLVRQTIVKDEQERIQKTKQQQEQQEFEEFRGKFERGMNRFDDFIEVVSDKPMDDAMTVALRGIDDPAAFIYAASKRMPDELERISKLKSPHQRYAEIIRLEQKLRVNKSQTKAPRSIERIKEDAFIPEKKKKNEETIEDLIAKSEAKKLHIIRKIKGV